MPAVRALRSHLSLIVLLATLGACGDAGPNDPMDPGEPIGPTPASDLSFLVGSWGVEAVLFDPSGDSLVQEGFATVSRELSGAAFSEVLTRILGDSTLESESLMMPLTQGSWLIARGNGERGTFDILGGRLVEGSGSFLPRTGTRPDGGQTRIRFDRAFADSVRIEVAESADEGATWRVVERYRYTRSTEARPNLPEANVCADAQYHQFDFWLGDWNAVGTSGQGGGRNNIRSRLGGCIVEENWNGGALGTSFNMYDPRTDLWYQVWVDTAGLRLVLQGGLNASGQMVLEGATVVSGQGQRVTWTDLADGTVRQTGEVASPTGGWTTTYDLIYSLR